jgi:hypothetical protein
MAVGSGVGVLPITSALGCSFRVDSVGIVVVVRVVIRCRLQSRCATRQFRYGMVISCRFGWSVVSQFGCCAVVGVCTVVIVGRKWKYDCSRIVGVVCIVVVVGIVVVCIVVIVGRKWEDYCSRTRSVRDAEINEACVVVVYDIQSAVVVVFDVYGISGGDFVFHGVGVNWKKEKGISLVVFGALWTHSLKAVMLLV